jgi:hypothetical protein
MSTNQPEVMRLNLMAASFPAVCTFTL